MAFDHFPRPFLEILRRPEVQREVFVGQTRNAAATLVKAVQEETAPPTWEGGVLFVEVVRQR